MNMFEDRSPSSRWSQFIPRSRRNLVALVSIVFLFLIGIGVRKSPEIAHIDFESIRQLRTTIEPSAGYFHVVLPTGKANARFCRTSLSSALLGYPYGNTINWEGELNEAKMNHEGAEEAEWEWGKLRGALNYVNRLGKEKDDDIVLIAEGDDSWFQLKPEVLLKRYNKIVTKATERLETELGKESNFTKPTIVFSAQRNCIAGDVNHISCYAAPEPPKFPVQVSTKDYAEHLSDIRPRYLNSAVVVGTASSLKKFFQLSYDRWHAQPNQYRSRDDLFSTIFGEQEYQRELLRRETQSFMQSILNNFHTAKSTLTNHPLPEALVNAPNRTSNDIGLTLDYHSLLSHVPDGHGNWIRYSEPQTINSAVAADNKLTGPPPTVEIDRDIDYSRPPFFSLAPYSSAYPFEYEDLPKDTRWIDVPLYTNLATGVTPCIIVNRALDEASVLQEQWPRMWFTPQMRKKMTNLNYEPNYPLATTSNEYIPAKIQQALQKLHATFRRTSNERRTKPLGQKQWWTPVETSPANKDREGIGFVAGKEWKKWAKECDEEVQAGIIGDGKGKWEDHKVFPPYPDLDHVNV